MAYPEADKISDSAAIKLDGGYRAKNRNESNESNESITFPRENQRAAYQVGQNERLQAEHGDRMQG